MALPREIMGSPLMDRFSFASSSSSSSSSKLPFLSHSYQKFPLRNIPRVVRLRKAMKAPMAAISEDLVVKASSSSVSAEKKSVKFKVRAVVTVRNKVKEGLKDTIAKHFDALAEKMGRNIVLQLVSNQIDPKTRGPRKSNEAVLEGWSEKMNDGGERVNYKAEFMVESDFGEAGAILLINKHQREFFLETITIEGFPSGTLHFICNSWVQATKDDPQKRVFFSNKAYLPNNTPSGIRSLRDNELRNIRGGDTENQKRERRLCDRIYDFDTYNDLGIPDKGVHLVRPTLGGSEKHPYPRRCRTGRPPTDLDMNAESRVEKPLPMYVPRDEQFDESKQKAISEMRLKGLFHTLIPGIKSSLSDYNQDFNDFSDVDELYSDDGIILSSSMNPNVPNVVTKIQECSQRLLKYDTPLIISKDKFAWFRDDEFARQTLAGVNPVNIERLKVFPPVSKLDPQVYGTQLDSALKEDHILGQINGMTVQQALEENKLFILDYHDIYLPFLDRINALDGRKSYATRTIFFLTPLGTLKPIAIELSLPPGAPKSRSKRVVTPPVDATTSWIWQLAKAHVCCNDSGVHQLVNHWLRSHACMEPFILSVHRQLSTMHPVFKLLEPHMRYTLQMNAMARQSLISAEGVIESCFTPGPYCMELSSAAYKNLWRFDMEALPANLIHRGIAEPDPTQPHGLKLLIEDYPYANDGLLIWSAIEDWVRTYVNHYYPNSTLICNDKELQSWYYESINVGHADFKHQPWWPTLNNNDDLVSILTTLIWVASAQHAALNFGQYPYGGYVPNRPPLMRRLVPEEGDPEYENFQANPQKFYLNSLPSLLQASKYMVVVDMLSTHSPDEEYLGERKHESIWSEDEEIIKGFCGFSERIKEIEKEIERRNGDSKLRNRCGAGVFPYELLTASSDSGVTGRGIPNSVST